MANIGVRCAKWAPITNEPANALPQYGDVVDLPGLEQVNDTPNFYDVKQYGDDVARNIEAGFKDCGLACQVNEMAVQTAGKLYGATYAAGTGSAPGTLTYKDDDKPPFGGFGFITSQYVEAVGNQYAGTYYPKVKAVQQGKNLQTKGETIVFGSDAFQLTAIRCNSGAWREESEPFSTLEGAQAWVADRVKKYVAPSGGGGGGGG